MGNPASLSSRHLNLKRRLQAKPEPYSSSVVGLPAISWTEHGFPTSILNQDGVSIVGRIALAPSKLYEFNGDEIGKIRQNVNIAGLEKEFNLKLLDFSVLQIDSEKASANKDGLLRQWLQPNLGIEKHHGYMFQWWALSALIAGLYLWFQVIRPQRNSRV